MYNLFTIVIFKRYIILNMLMAITEEELNDLLEPKADLEKITKISSDGQRLMVRIPKEVEEELSIQKGDKLIWLVKENENEIKLELQKNGS